MIFASTEVFKDYLDFLKFLTRTKKELEQPRDLQHGLATVQFLTTWVSLLSIGQYPKRFQKLFLKAQLREATSFREVGPGFVQAEQFAQICSSLHSFLRLQLPEMAVIQRDTFAMQQSLQQEILFETPFKNEIEMLFRSFAAQENESMITFIENDDSLPPLIKKNLIELLRKKEREDSEVVEPKEFFMIDVTSEPVQRYAKQVEYLKTVVIPTLFTFWGEMAPFLGSITICESDCVEFHKYETFEVPLELLTTLHAN